MPFAYPSCSDIMCLFAYDNTVSGGIFGNMVLVAIFVMLFITLMGRDMVKAFTAAAWVTFLASAPLAALGLINQGYPILLLALAGISLIPLFLGRK